MPQHNDLSPSLVPLDQDSTLIAIIRMSQSNWLVAALVPGLGRHPLKKIKSDEAVLLRRWQDQAAKAGRAISRTAVAFEAGRDGFWLARWLRARNIEAYVIHPNSVAVVGKARVRRGMLQLAWRFLLLQKESALSQWYRARAADARGGTRKTMIIALARKLLIALWRLVTIGEIPHGIALRPAT